MSETKVKGKRKFEKYEGGAAGELGAIKKIGDIVTDLERKNKIRLCNLEFIWSENNELEDISYEFEDSFENGFKNG